MQHHFLAYKASLIHYYVFGNGPKTLFCFHGYGENGYSFAFLNKKLSDAYTLYAIDFPFHGKTEWNEASPFMPEDLAAIMKLIHQDDVKFSLLAYSMGGRAAMHLTEKMPGKIKRVVLAAPDGLHQNTWYWLTTQTRFGNKAFAYTMNHPGWFFKAVNVADKLNLLNKSIVKFIHYYLDEEEERMLLYKRWTFMRRFKPNLQHIKQLCDENNIQLNFLFGEYDRIILSKRAAVFRQAKNTSIKIIHAGHQMMKEKYANEIAALLNG
ncbi:alpha/beta hydrolase [Parafilimonas sp.]|uniref:alpha/beta hydrolase n=1 Tax=Parafilimonas sp. TaxID=1969739 RepID=UPI0039E52EDC